jgi:Tol biopolymer transport system component
VALALPATAGAAPNDRGLIAYSDGASIFTIPSRGGTPRKLAKGISPSWSSDGRRIAYTGPGGVRIMSASGRHQRLLIRGAYLPTYSPDGRHLAYVGGARHGHATIIYVADVNGRHPVRTISSAWYDPDSIAGPAGFGPIAWSPSGRSLAFTVLTQGSFTANFEIKTQPARLDGVARTVASGSSVVNVEGMALSDGALSWSPDGTTLVTDGASYGPPDPTVTFNESPQISDDYAIGVNVETGALTPYEPAGASFTTPAWSPTGKQLCGLTSADGSKVTSVGTYALATNTVTPLARISTKSENPSSCAWQPRR